MQALQKKMQSIGDGQGKPTVEYVTLPFLRSKTSNFLFNGKTPLLFIRSQYITLYEQIMRDIELGKKDFYLDGNSGVGKSFFIYYFMYRLKKDKRTFRGYNCGNQSAERQYTSVSSSPDYLYMGVNWLIVDSLTSKHNISGVIYNFRLVVNSNQYDVVDDVENILKRKVSVFYILPQWSYADMCAVALSPQLIMQHSRAAHKISDGKPVESASASSANVRKFSVSHPLCILANFIAHRSTPRELLEDFLSLYYVVPEDQLKLTQQSSDILFLRASARGTVLPLPYSRFESAFDQSIAHIEQTRGLGTARGVALECWPGGDIPTTPIPRTDVVTATHDCNIDDFIFNTDVACWHRTCRAKRQPSLALLEPAFMGIAQELCMALKTHTDNTAFRELFSALLPIICGSVAPQMHKLIRTTQKPDEAAVERRSPDESATTAQYRLSGMFSFRRHQVLDADDPTHMPQYLSILDEEDDRDPMFFYSIRSTAIMNMIVHAMALAEDELRTALYEFFTRVFGSSGDGFCFEFISLENILRQNHIMARALTRDASGNQAASPKPSMPAMIRLTELPTRICYFYDIAHVVLDRHTLYVPFSSSYPAADAISMCLVSGEWNLVFYQVTAAETHPLKFPADKDIEDTRAMKMVKG
jgi:hypothetical protein